MNTEEISYLLPETSLSQYKMGFMAYNHNNLWGHTKMNDDYLTTLGYPPTSLDLSNVEGYSYYDPLDLDFSSRRSSCFDSSPFDPQFTSLNDIKFDSPPIMLSDQNTSEYPNFNDYFNNAVENIYDIKNPEEFKLINVDVDSSISICTKTSNHMSPNSSEDSHSAVREPTQKSYSNHLPFQSKLNKEERLAKNRQAALKCRKRKKEWVQIKQKEFDSVTAENLYLQDQLFSLKEEKINLKMVLASHNCSKSNV